MVGHDQRLAVVSKMHVMNGPVRVVERERKLPGGDFPDVGMPAVVAGDEAAAVGGVAENAVLISDGLALRETPDVCTRDVAKLKEAFLVDESELRTVGGKSHCFIENASYLVPLEHP